MDRQTSVPRFSGIIALLPELIPSLAALLVVVQSMAAFLLLARRLSGAIAVSASPGWLLGWVLVAALLAAATRALWFADRRRSTLTGEAAVLWAPLAALVITAAAFTSGGSSVLVTAAAWLMAIAEEAVTLLLLFRAGGFDRRSVPSEERSPVARPWHPAAERLAGEIRSAAPLERHVQRIQRVQGADERDVLSGSVAVRFSPGQLRQAVHIAFCPPFATMPTLEFRQSAGPPASVKVGQLLPHGVRFDIKLERTADLAVQTVLDVRAVCEVPIVRREP